MDEKIFRLDAKTIVDMCFDSRLFNDSMDRDKMNIFEDLICFLLKSKYESYKRAEKLLESLNKKAK